MAAIEKPAVLHMWDLLGFPAAPDSVQGAVDVKPAPVVQSKQYAAMPPDAASTRPHQLIRRQTRQTLYRLVVPLKCAWPVCLQASGALQDGAAQKPSYSLRTLCRALDYCRTAVATYGLQRALLDGLSMAFMTQLDTECAAGMEQLISRHVLGSNRAVQVSSPSVCI